MKSLIVDEVYDVIGQFGPVQIKYFICLSIIQIFTCYHMLLNIYTGLKQPFTCFVKNEKNTTSQYLDHCYQNDASKCLFEFKGTYSSIVSEWNLVCNEMYKVALVQSIWMGGVMAGALLLSGFSDFIGRKKSVIFSLVGTIVFEGYAAFAYTYFAFVVLRFLGGMCCSIVILSSFVLSQELIGKKYRSFCAITLASFFSIGIGILSLLASQLAHWRTLVFITSMAGLVFLIVPLIVPESPRWLVSKGKLKEAKRILEIIANKNGTLHKLPSEWELSRMKIKDAQDSNGICSLVSHPYLLTLTLIQMFSWFVNSAAYYALTIVASNLDGNVYWTTTINGLVEIPACISSFFIIERFGRRVAICMYMVVGGIVCLTIPFVPAVFVYVLALVGKLSISASFAVIYLHSAEIFPTVIRNSGMGIVSVAARIGGIASPFIIMLGTFHPNLHFEILGLLTLVSGILNTKLPETLGQPLPETISDLLAMGNFRPNEIDFKSDFASDDKKGYRKLINEDENQIMDI